MLDSLFPFSCNAYPFP